MRYYYVACLAALLVALCAAEPMANGALSNTRAANKISVSTSLRLRGGDDEDDDDEDDDDSPAPAPKTRPRSRGRGRGRGRGGRGRGRIAAIYVDTAVIGKACRNLTNWEDPAASKLAFAVGNAAFLAYFVGPKAIFMLWIAFLAAFLLPLRDRVDVLELPLPVENLVERVADLLAAATAFVKTNVVERFLPAA